MPTEGTDNIKAIRADIESIRHSPLIARPLTTVAVGVVMALAGVSVLGGIVWLLYAMSQAASR